MVLVAVPFISDQPAISGLDATFGDGTRLGDLPWNLHVAAEDEEKLLLGSAQQPASVLIDLPQPSMETIHRRLLPALATLHLHGSGSMPTREAWVFDAAQLDVLRTIQLPIRAFDPGDEFALRAGINEDALSTAYALVNQATHGHASLEVTLEHLLLALSRSDLSRGLIDATICLESLIKSQEEVAFRFSHQIGRIVSDGPVTLSEVQDTLKRLYSYRSLHVHGNRDNKYRRLQRELWNRWPEIERLMKACVTYALQFHANNTERDAWQQHIDGLMVGVEARQVPDWGSPV